MGALLTLERPTRDMIAEAAAAGFFRSSGWGQDYPRIQIRTIEELLHSATIQMPAAYGTFKQAPRFVAEPPTKNLDLFPPE
jgi:site-specific DNA-methyltransferase (adenine-specific)